MYIILYFYYNLFWKFYQFTLTCIKFCIFSILCIYFNFILFSHHHLSPVCLFHLHPSLPAIITPLSMSMSSLFFYFFAQPLHPPPELSACSLSISLSLTNTVIFRTADMCHFQSSRGNTGGKTIEKSTEVTMTGKWGRELGWVRGTRRLREPAAFHWMAWW